MLITTISIYKAAQLIDWKAINLSLSLNKSQAKICLKWLMTNNSYFAFEVLFLSF
jgi:hypothetical protein